ncbi:MAG TPA: M10 family metallopeptidase, partial [Aestuariivirga sp.]|nr:M10 family metallopeptidase [Aestuariivirga sp.]
MEVWTQEQIIDNLLRNNFAWTTPTISYGYLATAPSFSIGYEAAGFSALSAAQKVVAEAAARAWDDLIASTLVHNDTVPNISFENTSTMGGSYAYTWQDVYPQNGLITQAIWLNSAYNTPGDINNLMTPVQGDWGYLTYMHEMGHALGLAHPGNYNGGDPSYAVDALYTHDTVQYSIMSYFDADNLGADWYGVDDYWHYPTTPMLDDVAAIQALYGADLTTRTGDTVYGFNSTAGAAFYNFSQNAYPIFTIWDAGGTD